MMSEPMMRSHWSSRPIQSSMIRVPMPPMALARAEGGAEHVAEAADHGVCRGC